MGIHSDSFPPRLSTPKLQKIYTITQMDKAKAAVGSFLRKDGKHDTTVHETVNPAVTQENVTRTQHENVTTAVDREVHQDHHTLLCPFMRCTRTRQSTTPPPLSPLSPWTSSRSKEDT